MSRVEIFDARDGVLALDLGDVLDTFPGYVVDYRWFVLALEAIGNGLRGTSMLDTERIVESRPNGLQVTFEELQGFARRLEQTVNAIIFGGDERSPLPSLPVHVPSVGNYILIEAIDSSVWAVTANDQQVIDRLLKTFRNTTVTA